MHKIIISNFEYKEIKNIISKAEYEVYGFRSDAKKYEVGDILSNSHELYQDPQYADDFTTLLYPLVTEGIYKGYFDAGELNGTCAIYTDEYSIEESLNETMEYNGKYIYLIAGNKYEEGNDLNEVIIEDAKVLKFIGEK